MIKNRDILEKFEQKLRITGKSSFRNNLKIFNQMYKWAKKLGVFSDKNFDYIEKDIKIAKVINSIGKINKKSSKRTK